jgi:TRAP-type transport system periplasmic protein
MKLTPLAKALIAIGTLTAAASSMAVETIRLTAAAGHPPIFLWVKLVDEYVIPEVDRRLAASGKYKVEWTKAWGGTLIKLGAESKGIGDGVADLGIVATVFEAPKFPLQNVSYMAPFGTDDIGLVTDTITRLQTKVPAMSNAFISSNLVFLGGAALDTYHLWTSFPVHSIDDLKGKKISAPGASANWLKNTGAVAVAGSLNSYYEDIKSGVSNGAVTFVTGAWGVKLHEVAPYITKVSFGAQFADTLVVNKRRFDALPPEVREVFKEVGVEYSKRFAAAQAATAEGLMKKSEEAGAKISTLAPAERKRWAEVLPPVGQLWVEELKGKDGGAAATVLQGYIDGLKAGGVDLPRDWSKK